MKLASKIAAGIIASGVLAPVAAFAADPIIIPPPAPPPPFVAPVMNWTGPYLGLILGYGTGTKFWDNTPYGPWGTTTHNVRGLLIGAEGGFRFDTGGLVLGVEADWAWTNMNGASACGPGAAYTCATDLDWLATVTGQVGFAAGNILPYVEGGVAFARENFTVTGPGLGSPLAGTITNRGWVLGGGVVFGMDNFYVKAEYNFVNFGTFVGANANNGVVGADFDLTQRAHIFKLGVGFMF